MHSAGGVRRVFAWLLGAGGFVVALILVILLLNSVKKTPRDFIGISYGGGPIEGAHFRRVVEPGSSLFVNGLPTSSICIP